MSASSTRKQGWMDEFKKSASKKNVFENIEKERFLSDSLERYDDNIPQIDDIEIEEKFTETPSNKDFKKELNVDVLKHTNINLDDAVDLTILLEALEQESDIEEKDEVWNWNQLFTKVTAEIADEK